MTVSFHFEEKYFCYRLTGNHSLEETKAGFQSAFDDPQYHSGLNILVDARESLEKRTPNELGGFAEIFGNRLKRIGRRFALLIDERNRDQEGYEKVISSFSSRYQVEFFVFLSLEDAVEWLSKVP